MGNCCDSQPKPHIKKRQLELKFDTGHYLMASYKQKELLFTKINYDWHSIPVMSVIEKGQQQQSFQVVNRGIQNDSFLAGIIKMKAIASRVRTPWKTSSVICFESHRNQGESGIVSEGKMVSCGRGIKEGESLTVLVRGNRIQFRAGDESVGSKDIPDQFLREEFLPYVALFAEGDRIEFVRKSLGKYIKFDDVCSTGGA